MHGIRADLHEKRSNSHFVGYLKTVA